MFRKNTPNPQQYLFNTTDAMNPRLKKQLESSWAQIYFQNVFCKINEDTFAPLYAETGRPNFPVNVLLSLEFIKHLKNFSDEELLEQYSYNYQIAYAVGQRTLGELYLAPRTLYEFRNRIHQHLRENPDDDIIFAQFQELTRHFIKMAKLDTKEQRMDSTDITPNIRQATRLSLAVDVLVQAVEALPTALLNEKLRFMKAPDFSVQVLYKTKSQDTRQKLIDLFDIANEILSMDNVQGLPEIKILERFINEQTKLDENGHRILRENSEIHADGLQSAYETDATFRDKHSKSWSGYTLNLSETCSKENEIQIITDYALEKNIHNDVDFIPERLSEIKELTEITDLYTDGGYYSNTNKGTTIESGVALHVTDMTGRKQNPNKLPVSDFHIEENLIKQCPQGNSPIRSTFKSGVYSAHFSKGDCEGCPLRTQCPVKHQKQTYVLRVTQKSVIASNTRKELSDPEQRKLMISKRAGIEGTNSALKRGENAAKLRVRGEAKCRIVIGLKVIARNVKQFSRMMMTKIKPKIQGRNLAICPG